MNQGTPDVTVILPFRDHEEYVGRACRRIAERMAELQMSYEIVAIDQGSGDNSHSLLALLRKEIPRLRVQMASSRLALSVGAGKARGRNLVILSPESAASQSMPAIGRAVSRVACGEVDMIWVQEHVLVCRRSRCSSLFERPTKSFKTMLTRARARGLSVESYRIGGAASATSIHTLGRVFSAFRPRSAMWYRAW